jgi:signal transduction histidine kinase
MSFWNQVIELLSQSPGSLIYHFGVLFAIEATLGMAVGYRKRPAVRRVALAAGGMLAGRLVMMVMALLDSQGVLANPAAILPPLERVVDAIGVWLLIWALSPLFDKVPQWSNALAAGGVFVLLVLYFFSATAWYTEATQTVGATYNSSSQDAIWEVIQLGLLGAAILYTLVDRERDWMLQFGMLGVLFAVHVIHFGWASPAGNVAGWGRLGQLIAYPLLTVGTYRLVMGGLLEGAAAPSDRPVVELLGQIRQLGAVTATLDDRSLMEAIVTTVSSMTEAHTVALLALTGGDLAQVELIYGEGRFSPAAQASISLDKAPVLRWVANHKEVAFLRPGGTDDPSRLALLVHLLPETSLKVRLESALLVQPICSADDLFGVLAVQPAAGADDWPASQRKAVELLASQVATGLAQAHAYRRLQSRVAQLEEERLGEEVTGRPGELEAELNKARQVERELLRQLDAARQELARAERDVQGLDSWIELNEEQRAKIELLQRQLDAVTAELDKRRSLEAEGQPVSGGADPEQVAMVAQELRGPLASISGYTDLLMGESVGAVGELQRLFLQRIKASTERARVLLDDLVQTATSDGEIRSLDLQPVQIADVIRDTLRRLGGQIKERQIDLQIDLDRSFPPLELDRDLIEQILYHLLSNACQASAPAGEVAVAVRYEAGGPGGLEDAAGKTGYLFVSVRDSGGGVQLSDQPYVFDRHYRAEHPSIAGLGDTSMGLPVVRELLQAQGGRIWIESELDRGSTFSMVLPAKVARHSPS